MTLQDDLVLAGDLGTPEETLVRLAKSKSSKVRRAVAQNLATPYAALRQLFGEFPEDIINNPASAFFGAPGNPFGWVPIAMRDKAAKNPKTPPSVLDMLARDIDTEIRRHVAANTSTSIETLQLLSKDSSGSVRGNVASHPRTTPEMLTQMAGDTDSSVSTELATNPRTPPEALSVLIREGPYSGMAWAAERMDLLPEDAMALSRREEWSILHRIRKHPFIMAQPGLSEALKAKVIQAVQNEPTLHTESKERLLQKISNEP